MREKERYISLYTRDREGQRYLYESSSRFKNFDFLKCILRESIRQPPPSSENSARYPCANPSKSKAWLVLRQRDSQGRKKGREREETTKAEREKELKRQKERKN